MCIRELRERVASGGDPTKLRESLTAHVSANVEHGMLVVLLFQMHLGHLFCIFIVYFVPWTKTYSIYLWKDMMLFYGYHAPLEMDNSIGECTTIHSIRKSKLIGKTSFLLAFRIFMGKVAFLLCWTCLTSLFHWSLELSWNNSHQCNILSARLPVSCSTRKQQALSTMF